MSKLNALIARVRATLKLWRGMSPEAGPWRLSEISSGPGRGLIARGHEPDDPTSVCASVRNVP